MYFVSFGIGLRLKSDYFKHLIYLACLLSFLVMSLLGPLAHISFLFSIWKVPSNISEADPF